MSTLAPPINTRRIIMTQPAVLFAPLGVGYDGARVNLEAVQAGWINAGAVERAEVRIAHQNRKYPGRVGEPHGTRRLVSGEETVSIAVSFRERDFDLFGLLFGMLQVGGGPTVSPKVYAHRIGDTAEYAALIVNDNDDEQGGLEQTVFFFPHIFDTTGLSLDTAAIPLLFDLEGEARASLLGMPDGSQLEATHMVFHHFT